MGKPKSRRSIGKHFGFHKGHKKSPVKGKITALHNAKDQNRYVRVERDTFESRAECSDGMILFRDVDNAPTDVSLLRPRSNGTRLLDTYKSPVDSNVHPDLWTNRVYCPKLVQEMFNAEIKKHCVRDNCAGDLNFDANASRKWGLVWSERLKCTSCKYISPYYKLYKEVDTTGRGRKAAAANVGFQIGLTSTPVSNTGARRILVSTEIAPPSASSMQNLSNKIGSKIEQLNQTDMHDIRQKLREENELCGNKFSVAVRTESDSCFNNPLFKSETSPFQSGTIVATTVCENNTSRKQVIGVDIGNKLCRIGSRLRNSGMDVECPNHPGHCTSNLKESDTIGNEGRWSELVAKDIAKDLSIVSHTSDGDSKGHTGIEKGQKKRVLPLKDIRHLGNTLRRELNRAPFSSTMFSGKNKLNLRNRFTLCIKSRCVAELKKAHKVYKKDIQVIRSKMPNTINALVMCFRGYCGHMCKKYSLVCNGDHKQAKLYLPPNHKLKMTGNDASLLKKCVEVLLGYDNLLKTQFLTTTQKCEAVNRAYQTTVPKNVTFNRNCFGRFHGTIMKLNHGLADSMLMKSQALKIKLTPGSAVIRHLCKMDQIERRQRSALYRMKANKSRYAARKRRFNAHAEIHYKKGISDPSASFQWPSTSDHSYA